MGELDATAGFNSKGSREEEVIQHVLHSLCVVPHVLLCFWWRRLVGELDATAEGGVIQHVLHLLSRAVPRVLLCCCVVSCKLENNSWGGGMSTPAAVTLHLPHWGCRARYSLLKQHIDSYLG